MSAFSDPELNNQVTFLLENWGRWCRDDWWRHLGFSVPTTSRYYRAPIKDKEKKVFPPVDVDDAWRANEAIIQLGLYDHFDDHTLLVLWFAHGRTAIQLADRFGCHRATIYRWLDAAKREFWPVYLRIDPCVMRQKYA